MILILTDPATGGTFLTWTIHYLSGHAEYFSVKQNKWVPLTDDPVLDTNAHGFRPNQPITILQVERIAQTLSNTKTNTFHTLYFHNLIEQEALRESRHQSTFDVIKNITPKFNHVVVLNNNHPLYHAGYNRRAPSPKPTDHSSFNVSSDDHHADFINYFFQESYCRWQEAGLRDVWDHREFLALNIRPLRCLKINANVDLALSHFNLNTFDLYSCFDHTVNRLFDHLDLSIDQSRMITWKNIYHKWKTLHYPRMLFCLYFDDIIDYIVNGYNMDLTRFDLDIVQEACIQHHLIYHHGLNLKTWQLEKFQSTQQLHQLLVPNSHQLTEY